MKHEWDLLSYFCIHCGISMQSNTETPQKCYREKNITAISHTRAKTRTRELVHKVKESRKKNEL